MLQVLHRFLQHFIQGFARVLCWLALLLNMYQVAHAVTLGGRRLLSLQEWVAGWEQKPLYQLYCWAQLTVTSKSWEKKFSLALQFLVFVYRLESWRGDERCISYLGRQSALAIVFPPSSSSFLGPVMSSLFMFACHSLELHAQQPAGTGVTTQIETFILYLKIIHNIGGCSFIRQSRIFTEFPNINSEM